MYVLRGVYLKEIETWEPDPNEYDTGCEGDIFTVKEYLEMVKEHSIMDDDGHGHPVKDNKKDTQLTLFPSESDRHIPFDATHVIWYNK
jgi:hypothetical protein